MSGCLAETLEVNIKKWRISKRFAVIKATSGEESNGHYQGSDTLIVKLMLLVTPESLLISKRVKERRENGTNRRTGG